MTLLDLSWPTLYKMLYERRVNNWRKLLAPLREQALQEELDGNLTGGVEKITTVINYQLQGGLSGGLHPLCRMLSWDLCIRARLHLTTDPEKAFEDYCMATLVDSTNGTAYDAACKMARDRNSNEFADPEYDFDRNYDEEILHGTLPQRARFLFEFSYWRKDKCTVYLHMYLLCDMMKMWPSRLIQRAKRCAGTTFQAEMCDAWLLFDMKQEDEALEVAQRAVRMLPQRGTLLLSSQRRDAAFAYFTLGFVAQYSDAAVQAYHTFLEFSPHPARLAVTYNNLGSIYCHRGDYATALHWLNKARESNPRSFITYKTIAKCLSKQGERAAAYQVLTSALTFCSPMSADMYSERSKYTWLVTPDLNEATRMNPRLSYPYRFRAALYMEAAMQEKAFSELNKAIDLTYDPFDLSLLSAFKLDLSDNAGAVQDMRLALLMDFQNPAYRQWLVRHDAGAAAQYMMGI
jgi:tetratricopeptide (TPR) repeat protein